MKNDFLNLFSTPLAVLIAAFDALEYEGFFEASLNKNIYSIGVVISAFERLMDENALEHCPNNIPVGVSIYGFGAGNRYFIYPDGRIRFSTGHALSEVSRENARKLGFDVS